MKTKSATRESIWPLTILMAVAFCLSSTATDFFVFTSFRGNGEDGLHLALSTNGYQWNALKGDRSFLSSKIGAGLVRDPCLAKGPDNIFHIVWTSGWTTKEGGVIGYASSTNLINWSIPRGITLMENEPGTRNIWAPEIFFDRRQNRWLIFWSSTIPGRFKDSDQSGDDGYNHRVYFCTTRDFQQFTPSQLL